MVSRTTLASITMGVDVGVRVGVDVSVAVGVMVGVSVIVAVAVGVFVNVGDGVGVSVGAARLGMLHAERINIAINNKQKSGWVFVRMFPLV